MLTNREIAWVIPGVIEGLVAVSGQSLVEPGAKSFARSRWVKNPIRRLATAALLTAALDLVEIGYYYLNTGNQDFLGAFQGDIGNSAGIYFGLTIGRRLHNYKGN